MGKRKNLSDIKIVLTDVDGVLTDGGMYYNEKGDIMKKFHARDGMGVTLLRNKGIHTIIVTKENTLIVKQWAKNMKIEKLLDGILQKELILEQICNEYRITPKQIVFIGDDVNDIELMKKVGFSASPNDASEQTKLVCNYICRNNGGHGAFRELADLILTDI